MQTTSELVRCGPGAGRLTFEDHEPTQSGFLDAVIEGLSARERSIPYRFLYDEAGSKLFDAITRLPEYYPTRTEIGILKAHADDIADHVGPDAELIELGSGSSDKVGLLLDALERPAVYVPIDISCEHLMAAAHRIAEAWPRLEVHAICSNFDEDFALPQPRAGGRRLGFYPGSTIGNFAPGEAREFLADWARRLGKGAQLLIGVDLQKSAEVLNAAYDDAQGVTARFTLNLLARANRELGADFDLGGFRHEALYLEDEGRVGINLVSLRDQTVTIDGRAFGFAAGERVHVEDSWKYTIEGFRNLAADAGYRSIDHWTDADHLFSVHLLEIAQ